MQTTFAFVPKPRAPRIRVPKFNADEFAPLQRAVYRVLCTGLWYSLREIQAELLTRFQIDCETTSISARIREIGVGYRYERRVREGTGRVNEYRVLGVK